MKIKDQLRYWMWRQKWWRRTSTYTILDSLIDACMIIMIPTPPPAIGVGTTSTYTESKKRSFSYKRRTTTMLVDRYVSSDTEQPLMNYICQVIEHDGTIRTIICDDEDLAQQTYRDLCQHILNDTQSLNDVKEP